MRIRFENISVELGPGVPVLRAASGEFLHGTATAVIGPSGAGKSTLLRVLAGLQQPSQGKVYFDDQDVTDWPPERRRLGVVFQDLRLFPFLSGRENVGFAPKVAGLSAREQAERVDAALQLTRATAFADRPAPTLSGGEKQRIALARALAMQPQGLLLDEPFGALDAQLRLGLRDELRQLIQALRLPTVLITHDRDDAFALASRVLVLREGRVEQASSVEEGYARPATAFVATLLGEANLLTIEERRPGQVRVGPVWLDASGEGKRAVIRPEQLALSTAAGAAFRGMVQDARFAGGHWRLTVAVPGVGSLIALTQGSPAAGDVALSLVGSVHTVE